jgi:molybdopterin-guanine dinucleotide biosynthesis protein A
MTEAPRSEGAIVLAGGRSSRMGRDKAVVVLDGAAMIERVLTAIEEALGVGAKTIVLAARGQTLPPSKARVLRDESPFAGPLVALATGLEVAREDGWDNAYIAAVDHGRLVAAHVRECAVTLQSDPEAWAALPVVDDFDRPLASMVRVGPASKRARRLVTAGERSARSLFRTEGVIRFSPANPDSLRSFDLPGDLDVQ